MGAFEKANDLAILAGGRKPQWEEQATYTGAPSTPSSGVYLENALAAAIAIGLREEAHRRTARVTVDTLDLAADYTVTIGGVACTAAGPHASLAALLSAIDVAVDAGAGATVPASVTDEDGDSVDDTVLIVGDAEADWTIAVSATGTGVLDCVADASTGAMRVWAKMREDDAPDAWLLVYDQDLLLTRRGFLERYEIGGLDRIYVELYDLTYAGDGGTVTYSAEVKIGPCVVE